MPVETGLPSTIIHPSYTKSSPNSSRPFKFKVKFAVVGVLSSSLLQEVANTPIVIKAKNIFLIIILLFILNYTTKINDGIVLKC